MEFFCRGRDIPFMRYSLAFNVISLITFIIAVFFLIYRGLHLSIEFTGGTVLEVHYPTAVKPETVRDVLSRKGYEHLQVQTFGTSNDVLIRLPFRHLNHDRTVDKSTVFQQQQTSQIIDALTSKQPDIKLRRVEFVGPQVGDELAKNGLLALLCVVIGIAIYLSVRFEWKYAVAGIIANLHDVIIILGFFAFFQWEFSLPVLAAVLAVLGYSVNESVVIFDRIRETFINDKSFSFYKHQHQHQHQHQHKTVTVPEVINHAITSTMSRTLITHGSTQMMVLSMLAFGGPTLHFFSLALTIGILFGIYSSVFVAASLAMWLGIKREDLIKPHKKPKYDPHDPNAGAQV